MRKSGNKETNPNNEKTVDGGKMENQFSRMELVFGKESIEKLKKTHVAVFGIGGVGGYAVEALVRAGIGEIDIIDNDKVSLSNLNRQLIATHKTLGCYKVDVAEERILEINPDCVVHKYKTFYLPDKNSEFDFAQYDYIVDAIDTITGKIGLIQEAEKNRTPIISAMGAGNKLDPTAFKVADIYETSVCPLCHVMRKELKKRGIKKLKVVYSKEQPIKTLSSADENMDTVNSRRQIPGSTSFVPPVVGFIIAGEVIKNLIAK